MIQIINLTDGPLRMNLFIYLFETFITLTESHKSKCSAGQHPLQIEQKLFTNKTNFKVSQLHSYIVNQIEHMQDSKVILK